MRTIKTHKAELDSKRTIFFEIGIVISLAAILLAFEIKSFEKQQVDFFSGNLINEQEELVEITQHEKLPPPPTPPQQTTLIQIVENEMEVEEELDINVEADQETAIETYVPFTPVEIEDKEIEEEQVFVVVESMPSFPGGEAARIKYLSENMKYPEMAREANVQGNVFVTFVVEKNGEISDVRILRGIGAGCDEEAIRVVKSMPRWVPGKQRNVAVRVQFNMPIKFVLL